MKKYRRQNTTLSSKGIYLKKRISRNRRRAKNVGLLYLLGIIALAAVACLPLFTHKNSPVGIMEFYKQFTGANFKNWKNADTFVKLANSGLYALMLLGLVVNVLKAFGKLNWLFKKTAHRDYGFNRNVYAMEDLGRIYSGSFAVLLTAYFLIAILCGEIANNMLMVIVLGGGVVLHLLCGFWGAKTGYYDVEEGEIIEHNRAVGRFAPLLRNVLQLGAIFGIMYFFLKASVLHIEIPALLQKGGVNALTKDMDKLLIFAAQALTLLFSFVLIKHATAITEYNPDGVHGAGMKNFRVFSFLAFLTAGAAVAVDFLMGSKKLNVNMLIVSAIAFAMFLIEVLMRNRPKFPEEEEVVEEEVTESDEIAFEALSHANYEPQTKKEKKAAKKAAKKQGKEQAKVVQETGIYPMLPVKMNAPMPMANGSVAKPYPQPMPYPQPYPVPQPYPMMSYPMMPYHAMPYGNPMMALSQQQQPMPAPAPAAAPAPSAPSVNILPIVPINTMQNVTAKEEKEEVVEEEVNENLLKVEDVKMELNCPRCGAKLRVDTTANYHRCPACRKVFELRKFYK